MDCEQFRDALNSHAAGADLPKRVAAHLDACERCQTSLESERQLIAMIESDLATTLSIEPVPELSVRVRAQIAGEAHRVVWWSGPWMRPAAALVAAGLVVAVISNRENIHVTSPTEPGPLTQGPGLASSALTPAGATLPIAATRSAVNGTRTARPQRGPEVLVPRGQEEALLALQGLLVQGRVDLSSVGVPVGEAGDELPLLPELSVAPLSIELLPQPVVEGDKENKGADREQEN